MSYQPFDPQSLSDSIAAILNADNGVSGIFTVVGGKVYELQAPPNTLPPLVTYGVISPRTQSFFNLSHQISSIVQVDCYQLKSSGIKAARALADRVIGLFDDQHITVAGFSDAWLILNGFSTPKEEIWDGVNSAVNCWRVSCEFKYYLTQS